MALRPKLNRVWTSANAALRRDPEDAKYLQGWVSEIPTFQVLNYLQYKVDTTLLAQAERGIFEWGSDVSYVLGSIVWCENDKKIYISTVGSPDKTKAPNTNLSQWSPSSIQVPRASFDAILASINSHIANTANPHNLSATQLGSYTKAETDALVAQYRALVLAHSSDKNNPHGLTALKVGAVPATGGTYTGDVTFNGGMYFDAGKVNQISKTSGLYLQAGPAVIGIDATGVPVVGTTASKSPIVSEATFPALKAAQEANYAVQEPIMQMDLLGNICLRRGVGRSETVSFEPTYDTTQGNALVMDAPAVIATTITLRTPDSTTLYSMGMVTMAMDILLPAAAADSEVAVRMEASSAGRASRLNIGENNVASGERTSTASGSLVTDTGGVKTITAGMHRLAISFSATEMRLYVDGVLAVTSPATNTATGTAAQFSVTVTRRSAARSYRIKNMRIWDTTLTDKQISTL